MNYNAELLFATSIGIVAIITFVSSLIIRFRIQKREALLKELREASLNHGPEPLSEIIAVRTISPEQSAAKVVRENFSLSHKNTSASFSPEKSFSKESSSVNFQEPSTADDVAVQRSSELYSNHFSDLISIFVVAQPGRKFIGYDLLQALLAAGFRYGEMSIFHRHQRANGEGAKLFSLASATEPGTFDMNRIGAFSSQGLCLFMQLKGPEHNLAALSLLLKTAEMIADDLQGVVLGADRMPLNDDMVGSYQRWVNQHLRDFEVEEALA